MKPAREEIDRNVVLCILHTFLIKLIAKLIGLCCRASLRLVKSQTGMPQRLIEKVAGWLANQCSLTFFYEIFDTCRDKVIQTQVVRVGVNGPRPRRVPDEQKEYYRGLLEEHH